MLLTQRLLGQHFGELAKIHGIVIYKISPFEQKAFAGAISAGVPNTVRRFQASIAKVLPPFVIGYLVYKWAEARHVQLGRKDPKEFENDS